VRLGVALHGCIIHLLTKLITGNWNLKGHDESEVKSSVMKQPAAALAHRVKFGLPQPILARGQVGKP
jgi:hypothetical protein